MRSDKKLFNLVAFDPLHLKDQIGCQYCRGTFMGGTSRTVLDDSGSLAITAWTCARCGGVIEEIRILTQDEKVRPRPIRYAVAPSHSPGRLAPVAHHELRN
jgi:DNA-directed RNA polymerase subunit RPC12/RpoP